MTPQEQLANLNDFCIKLLQSYKPDKHSASTCFDQFIATPEGSALIAKIGQQGGEGPDYNNSYENIDRVLCQKANELGLLFDAGTQRIDLLVDIISHSHPVHAVTKKILPTESLESSPTQAGEGERDQFAMAYARWAMYDPQAKAYREARVTASKLLELYKSRPYIDTNPNNQ